MLQKINRGDVYYYNFGYNYEGSVEGKCRPCVIISNDKGNNYGTTALVAPITTRSKDSCKPWQVYFKNGNRDQIILCEQIKVVSINKLLDYQGRLDPITIRAIDEALALEFDLQLSDKELNNNEILKRLDDDIKQVLNSRLNAYDNKINELIMKVNSIMSSNKLEFERTYNKVINEIHNNGSNNDVLNELNTIKSLFNKNSDNLDKILSSLINLYKDLDNKEQKDAINISEEKISENKDNTVTDNKDVVVENKIPTNRKKRYTLDYAITFVTDYYNIKRSEFMDKYKIADSIQCNNKLATMRTILKKNNIDYEAIKYQNRSKDIVSVKEEFKTVSSRIEAFKYSEENCLNFINEWNVSNFDDMCKKYHMTAKQLINRKYLIGKWLTNHNIEFKVVDRRQRRLK